MLYYAADVTCFLRGYCNLMCAQGLAHQSVDRNPHRHPSVCLEIDSSLIGIWDEALPTQLLHCESIDEIQHANAGDGESP